MKVSLNWLNDLVNIENIKAEDLAEKITRSGIEVETVERLTDSTNIVVGHVLEREDHPDAKLSVCKVDLGEEVVQICCGAPNVAKGQKVVVAKIGAVLPGNFNIKQAVLRGVESNGMICSLEEVGLDHKYIKDEFKDGIEVLKADAPVGVDALEYLGLDDTVLELSLTPNRNDALSMLGVAYEVAAILNEDVKYEDIKLNETNEQTSDLVSVTVNTENNPKYVARVVKDVVIKESPQFIQARLIAAGIRPINNVVDITNYVMLELGQPLHAFDYDILGNEIVVRMAEVDEEVVTLDGVKRQLKDSHIVITNGKEVVAVAGVMGCSNTEVSENTTNVLLESAYFDALTVRLASKDLGLRSESSLRFEKGLDPNRVEMAIDRAAQLLEMYADGKVLKGKVMHDELDHSSSVVSVSQTKINSVLGMDISKETIENIFLSLGFGVTVDGEIFDVEIPTRRMDIKIAEDLIEEVGRLYGYDKLESKLPKATTMAGGYSESYLKRKRIHTFLQGLGLNQVITYSLTNEEKAHQFVNEDFDGIKLAMPLSEERAILRYSLIPSLLEVINYNKSRNINDATIYEIGTSYYNTNDGHNEELKLTMALSGMFEQNLWQGKKLVVDFYTAKGIVEGLLNYLGLTSRYTFKPANDLKDMHPGRSAKIVVENKEVGFIGQVHPKLSKTEVYVVELSLEKIFNSKVRGIKCKEISKYPKTSRDLAFVVDRDVHAGDIINTIKRAAGRILVDVNVFDVYQGENIDANQVSLAFKLIYQDPNQTLTDEAVNNSMNTVIERVQKAHKAQLRG